MSEQPYNNGGCLPPPQPIRMRLHPDECVVRFEDDRAVCVRADHQDRTCSRRPTD
ncbi:MULTISPECIES: hypothetical protein [unclassified Micromonospora]|uniref:hypothetical protein n=1 Tax=unclassified Micromonospora TaxID=2617518 RepID=UPI003326B67C